MLTCWTSAVEAGGKLSVCQEKLALEALSDIHYEKLMAY